MVPSILTSDSAGTQARILPFCQLDKTGTKPDDKTGTERCEKIEK
jgi:hypothetical protein